MDITYRVADRDWTSAVASFHATSPYNYAVIDDFLDPQVCARIHQEILAHEGWTDQSHDGKKLYSNHRPNLPSTLEIARQLKALCPELVSAYELVDSWVLLHPAGAPRLAHSDVGALTLNLWMTPDECNLEPSSGGLVFYDVKRRDRESPDEDSAYLWSNQYLNDHTRNQSARVSYRRNRALLFDARTFHRTDEFQFTNADMGSYRMNYSLTFDDPDAFERTSRILRGDRS